MRRYTDSKRLLNCPIYKRGRLHFHSLSQVNNIVMYWFISGNLTGIDFGKVSWCGSPVFPSYTSKETYFVVGGALILLPLVAASIFFQGIIIKHTAIGLLAIMFIFVAFAYIRIYLVIRKVKRPKPTPHDKAGEGNRRGLFREAKHAISCFIVVVCFVLFIIPYTMFPIFVQFGRMTLNAYRWWSVSLLLLISTTNSTIFFWRNAVLRKEAAKVMKNIFKLNAEIV